MVGATFFSVGVLVIFLSTTLPRASGHLRFSTFREDSVLRWYFAMRVLPEFAVIGRAWNLNSFCLSGSDEQRQKAKSQAGKEISGDAHVRYCGIISLNQRGERVCDDQKSRAGQCARAFSSAIRPGGTLPQLLL